LLKHDQIKEKYFEVLKSCFSKIPNSEINLKLMKKQAIADAALLFKSNGIEKQLFVVLTNLGTPKRIRNAINQLLVILSDYPQSYGIVIAPYISARSAEMCKQENIGYVDLSGNFWIAFNSIFLSQENMPNKFPIESNLTNLYASKTERVLRVLLTYPYEIWKTKNLAEEANISMGMITHIRRRLEEEEWVQHQEVGFSLLNPQELLMDWVNHYDFLKHEQYDFYTMEPLIEAETRVIEICVKKNIFSALTGFSAANHLAPMVKGQKSTIFINQDILEVAREAGLKRVNSGANINLINPYDLGVFWNRGSVQDFNIATPVQVYLDLMQMRGRGEEAANFLFAEVIQKRWEYQKNNMIPG
jgi:hypothetical protein